MARSIRLEIIPIAGDALIEPGSNKPLARMMFDLKLPEGMSLPIGHYRLKLAGSERISHLENPSFYLDMGGGVSARGRMAPVLRPDGRRAASVYLHLDQTPRLIRFDPEVAAGRVQLSSAELVPVSRLGWYGRLAAMQARQRFGSVADARRTLGLVAKVYRERGLQGIAAQLRQHNMRASAALSQGGYGEWIARYDTISETRRLDMQREIAAMRKRPLISIVMPTYNTPERLLRDCIDSVIAQIYPDWELCIADDCSRHPHVRAVLEEYAARDPRIKLLFRETNGHISNASNSAISLATGQWIALLDHDDELRPHALYHVAKAINANPNARLFYSDEDKIDISGTRSDPYFKCDWNPDLFLSHNLITHLGVYDAALVRDLGGFRPEFDGAQDYDLALRSVARIPHDQIVHIPHVLYHWRVIPGSTAMGSDEKPYAMLAGERALNAHLAETGAKARAELIGFGFRVRFDLPKRPPRVSIIIPTRNGLNLLSQCVASIRDKTTYRNYEIVIVDNGSDDEATLRYLADLEKTGGATIIRDPSEFNYSALNNRAVAAVTSEIVVLMNNDIEVISPDWLDEMAGNAIQPGVGAVGAMLYYPDNTIQHGGVVMGLGGYAAHAHWRFPRGTAGYVGRAALRQSYSAVTAACLAVRREHYVAVGGLDEENFKVAYNDVDFCLKLRAHGLRNVWTPFAELYHHESATRGYETTPEKQKRFDGEKANLKAKWQAIIDHDPAYNPNLTLDHADFSLAFPPRVTP
ncbi:MAG: glycosyltransferase family 2 protein [Rhizobiaceae bacterium]|nr:glycosyltransferase family 2 protein [Rhizobiaceae bacterium]